MSSPIIVYTHKLEMAFVESTHSSLAVVQSLQLLWYVFQTHINLSWFFLAKIQICAIKIRLHSRIRFHFILLLLFSLYLNDNQCEISEICCHISINTNLIQWNVTKKHRYKIMAIFLPSLSSIEANNVRHTSSRTYSTALANEI